MIVWSSKASPCGKYYLPFIRLNFNHEQGRLVEMISRMILPHQNISYRFPKLKLGTSGVKRLWRWLNPPSLKNSWTIALIDFHVNYSSINQNLDVLQHCTPCTIRSYGNEFVQRRRFLHPEAWQNNSNLSDCVSSWSKKYDQVSSWKKIQILWGEHQNQKNTSFIFEKIPKRNVNNC